MDLYDLRCVSASWIGAEIASSNARIRNIAQRKSARWLDDAFFEIVRCLNTTGFIECGARDASASRRFLREGGRRAVALEANQPTYEQKTKHAEDDGVIALNAGVGPRDGEFLDFFVPASHSTASNASLRQKPGVAAHAQRVISRSIDAISSAYFAEDNTALWVDVEGMAFDVFQGAETALAEQQITAIKVEVETSELWQGQHLAGAVDAQLQKNGYCPVLCDFEYREQFNVIYVRSSARDMLDPTLRSRQFSMRECRPTRLERLFKSRNYPWRKVPRTNI